MMDLQDAGATVRYLIRDRDTKFPALFDEVLADAGIAAVLTGIRMPRMNALMEDSASDTPAPFPPIRRTCSVR